MCTKCKIKKGILRKQDIYIRSEGKLDIRISDMIETKMAWIFEKPNIQIFQSALIWYPILNTVSYHCTWTIVLSHNMSSFKILVRILFSIFSNLLFSILSFPFTSIWFKRKLFLLPFFTHLPIPLLTLLKNIHSTVTT